MNNINVLDNGKCTGCGLCMNICPKQAITMQPDREGFPAPVIISDKCIDCGICYDNCPQLNHNDLFNEVKSAHAVICSDNIRSKCSSGGVFGAIGKWALDNDGIVFGAAFTEDFRNVHHTKAQNKDELLKLCKSKYFQSSTEMVYSDVKEALATNKKVVFSGCSCQVDALRRYLKKDYENLITIDILCHGVVSPKAYQLFMDEFFGDVDSPIKTVDFRPKDIGWACNIFAEAEDGTKRIDPYKGSYFSAFLWGYSQRKACFSCKYARPERCSDITIGDFWGIDDLDPEMNDKKGTSLVLCNTPKGKEVLKAIGRYIGRIKEYNYQDVIRICEKVNWAVVKPGIKPANRDAFFYRLSRGDKFSQALRYVSSPKYDVGIFGWWFEDNWTNYGSTLTYYALMEYVSSLGLSVCMLASPFHTKEKASDFIRSHGYIISKTYKFEEFSKHNENINTFLIGSDQLWFYDCYKRWGHSLFLDFADDDKKKIAYATSFGHKDPHIPDGEIPKVKKLLRRFDAVSSREKDGVEILQNKFGIEAVQNLDPVFLCDMKNWDDIAEEAERKTEGRFLFTYMLDPTSEKIEALKYLSTKLKLKVVSITDKQYDHERKEKMLSNYGILLNATLTELIYHLKNAEYIMTDSYHGTCFSLVFRKKFVSVINATRGISRFDTLAELFGVGDRFVHSAKDIIKNESLLTAPDYNRIVPLIEKETQRSKAWLNDRLLCPKKAKPPIGTILPEHHGIIKDFNVLHQLGYSVGRYLRDIGIDTISVYCEPDCFDIFEKFLISLNLDNAVNVTRYYSKQSLFYYYAQSRNFGCANFQAGFPTSGVVIYVSDTPSTIKIGDCKVYSLVSLMWKALSFASIHRPLVQYKNEHPNINILVVNFPAFPPAGRRDEREEYIKSHAKDYWYENLKDNLPKTFSVFGEKRYSEKDWVEMFMTADSQLDFAGKRRYLDLSSRFVNIKDGHRVTLEQPTEYTKTIFMLGGCITYGYGCADNDTSSSYLQKIINDNNIGYKVENYGAFLNYRRKDMYQTLYDLPVKDGDVIIAEVWKPIPDFCGDYFDFIDLRELFFRPHSYGNVFLDYVHFSHLGQKVIANKIFERLRECDFYNNSGAWEPDKKIDVKPLNVFGVPEDHIMNSERTMHPKLKEYLDGIKSSKPRIGAIVMNCNPFTLGHRYLIETAAKQCLKLYVFVVEEDKSVFKFEDRIELVRQGTKDIPNVTVLPSGQFMISSLTFTDYFNKSKIQDKQIDPSMDVNIFAEYIAPAMSINVRFAGEEPLDKVTKQYNDAMRRILPQHDIEFVEIPRKESGEQVISASRVRRLLDERDFKSISKLVPGTTLSFLIQKFAD